MSVLSSSVCVINMCVKTTVLLLSRGGVDSGSFVKPKLLKARLMCREAVQEKYGRIEDENVGIDESNTYLPSSGGGRLISIDVVGMKQINDLQW